MRVIWLNVSYGIQLFNSLRRKQLPTWFCMVGFSVNVWTLVFDGVKPLLLWLLQIENRFFYEHELLIFAHNTCSNTP